MNVNVNFIAPMLLSKCEEGFLHRVSFAESATERGKREGERGGVYVILVVLRRSRPFVSLSSPRCVCATRWRLNAKGSSRENRERDEKSGIAERAGKGKIGEGSSTRR